MHTGPLVKVLGDLEAVVDASSYRANPAAKETNILDYSTWQLNGTAATGFSRNGGSDENIIISGTGPFGENALIWEARPNGAGGADGGWNSGQFSVDNTKLYRFSVWVRRTVYDNGRFYFGTRGYGSTNGVYQRNNGANSTNPYCYVTADPPTTSQLPSNTWVLVVFHVWPAGSGTGDNHPDSGLYTQSGGKYAGISLDFVWRSETTTALHRTYLYYAEATTPRQQWVYPRVDIVDGNEPSIEELLEGYTRSPKSLSGKGRTIKFNKNVRPKKASSTNSNIAKAFHFDGTDDLVTIDNFSYPTSWSHPFSIEVWVNIPTGATWINAGSGTAIIGRGGYAGSIGIIRNGTNTISFWARTDNNTFNPGISGVARDTWIHIIGTWDGVNTAKCYANGEYNSQEISSNTAGSPDNSNWYIGGGIAFGGSNGGYGEQEIGLTRIYKKALNAGEVRRLYNATKNRFSS